MTLLWTEGFDWLQTSDLPTAYAALTELQPIGSMTATIETGRVDNALQIIPGAVFDDQRAYYLQGYTIPLGGVVAGAEVIIGFAVRFVQVQDRNNLTFMGIRNAGITNTTNFNLSLFRTETGVIAGGFNSDPTPYTGAIGKTIIAENIWYYVEVKFVSDDSAGILEVRVNGVVEFALTSLDTLRNDDNYVSLVLGSTIPGSTIPTVQFDDVYVCDDLGTTNNDFLGDIQCQMIKPNGNGNTSNMTGSDGNSVDNYLLVDDAGAIDDDTTYVEDNVSANKDTYAYENTTNLDTIFAVNVKTIAKKVVAGSTDLLAVARSNTTESDSSSLGMTIDYTQKHAIFEEDPDNPTSPEWTTATVDAAEFGVKIA